MYVTSWKCGPFLSSEFPSLLVSERPSRRANKNPHFFLLSLSLILSHQTHLSIDTFLDLTPPLRIARFRLSLQTTTKKIYGSEVFTHLGLSPNASPLPSCGSPPPSRRLPLGMFLLCCFPGSRHCRWRRRPWALQEAFWWNGSGSGGKVGCFSQRLEHAS